MRKAEVSMHGTPAGILEEIEAKILSQGEIVVDKKNGHRYEL
jgi:hypothetical protein